MPSNHLYGLNDFYDRFYSNSDQSDRIFRFSQEQLRLLEGQMPNNYGDPDYNSVSTTTPGPVVARHLGYLRPRPRSTEEEARRALFVELQGVCEQYSLMTIREAEWSTFKGQIDAVINSALILNALDYNYRSWTATTIFKHDYDTIMVHREKWDRLCRALVPQGRS